MNKQNAKPILEVLEDLRVFAPIKICFNDTVLYNDYDSTEEIEPGLFGEILPYMIAVPMRLKTALDEYDVWINRLDIHFEHHHHCIVYMHGEKIKKEYYDQKV